MWQIAGILGISLVATLGAFKMYADKTEAEKEVMALDLRQAADNQIVLESSITILNKQLMEAEERQKRILNRVNELQAANAQSQKEVESIRKKFAKHDINVLSLRKPGLIEKIINRGTKGVLNDLEDITDPAS